MIIGLEIVGPVLRFHGNDSSSETVGNMCHLSNAWSEEGIWFNNDSNANASKYRLVMIRRFGNRGTLGLCR
jgi:hypothetical protein